MNKQRRKAIDELIKKLEAIQGAIEDIQSDATAIKDEEEEYRDNMPENLHGSEKHEAADDAVNNLEAVADAFNELDIDDLITKLNEAQA